MRPKSPRRIVSGQEPRSRNVWSIRGDVKDIFLPRPEGSIRGDVKDIFLPRPEGGDIFLPSSPCARDEALGGAARILHGSISIASLLSSDDVDRVLKLASRGGCLVGNT